MVEPLRGLLLPQRSRSALIMLAFMVLYKLGDNMATALSTPFYLDLGFSSRTQIGTIAKLLRPVGVYHRHRRWAA